MELSERSDSEHFVPQFYLKGWCPHPAKSKAGLKFVRAWSIHHGRIPGPVSIRDECSRPGFYGPKENYIDQWLSLVEKTVSKEIWQFRSACPPRMPTEDEEVAMRVFMCTQIPRTRYTEEQLRDLFKAAHELFDDPRDVEAVQEMLRPITEQKNTSEDIPRSVVSLIKMTSDLGLLVVHNDTGSELVTSDNPVVAVNHAFPRHLNMGYGDAGLLVVWPVSPRTAIVLYDKTAYRRKKVASCTKRDVRAMNFIQACNARNNLYFCEGHTDLATICAKAERHRRGCTPYIALAESEGPDRSEILHFGFRRPNPRVSFSFALPKAKFRRKYASEIGSSSSEFRVPQRKSLLEQGTAMTPDGRGPEYATVFKQIAQIGLQPPKGIPQA